MVTPPAPVSGGLEALPARPPTPPRETQQRSLSQSRPLHPLLNLQTPPGHSPSSFSDSSLPTSQRLRKKVGFSGQAEYQEPPIYIDKKNAKATKQPTPLSLPSSAASNKPLKSILKPSPGPNPLDPAATDDQDGARVNLAAMLESTIKQLAGADRDCKLDAYMMLVRALKVSNNLPDRIALQDKMSLFAQFIQRDVTTKNPDGSLDSSLVNHALTLLVTFQHFPAIASTLTSDFGVSIIDHCIRSFEDGSVPKDVVRHLMQVVASQEFSPKVMTADRIGRLVAALHNIENHLQGKSIVMSRIIIYRKLVKQSKLHMLSHSDWLLDLFTNMLSSLKEIRAAAIALGFDACITLGKEKQLSKRIMEILQVTVDDTKYIEYYIEKLKAMTKDKSESVVVPQIWSIVVLLLRYPIDRWEYFVPWLDIIQKCFNSSDWQTKHEANLAWNRLVYTLQHNEASFYKTLGTMCQPFVSQLRRKVTGAKQEDLRRTVLGSICNLYYYAFKPNTNPAHLDTLWKTCVAPLVGQLVLVDNELKPTEKQSTYANESMIQAATLLTGLFDSSTPRLWKEDRVFDKVLIKSDELPAIDPKWIRRNAAKAFQVAGPILEFNILDLSDPGSNASKLWRTLVNAVVAAASKEVKVSTDTAIFIGSSLSFLLRIWSSGLDDADMTHNRRFLAAIQQYLTIMISSLGLLPFTEKQLSVGKHNTFVPVATPSHRDGKGHGPAKSPLYHLFWILSTRPPNIPDDENMCNLIKAVLSPFFASRPALGCRDLAADLMQSLPQDASILAATWQFVADIIVTTMEDSQGTHSSTSSSSGPTLGHEYRGTVKHLERGLLLTSNLQWDPWQSLFKALADRATEESGVAGCAVAVIEPLAKTAADIMSTAVSDIDSGIMMKVGCELISRASHPRDRQALDAARRRLWGTLAAGTRASSFDPYDGLYRLINALLTSSYDKFNIMGAEEAIARHLDEVARFLSRANNPLAVSTLISLQSGVSCWLSDVDNRLNSKQPSPLFAAVQSLWERICSVLSGADGLAQLSLSAIEPLLCGAFKSKHRHVVLSATSLWNQAFENADAIEYPPKLETVLLSIQPYVDIILPGLQIATHGPDGQEPGFLESQHNFDNSESEPADINPSPEKNTDDVLMQDKTASSRPSSPAGSVKLSFPAKQVVDTTPRRTLRKRTKKRSSTSRLRHDDSQIHFAAIESSSPSRGAESQHLTERQMEVRERQRDASALFPDLRSSPSNDTAAHEAEPQLPTSKSANNVSHERATTPQANQTFDEFVSSTPTPRRGQAALIVGDQYELDEVPSSPPEPRRNLLPEMRTRSRSSSSIMEDFQFSSSPVSGSPSTHRQFSSKDEVTTEEPDILATETHSAAPQDQAVVPEQTLIPEKLSPLATTTRPLTPPNKRRTRSHAESPKSDNDNEVFVDALTSPQGKSPRQLRSSFARIAMVERVAGTAEEPVASRSFELSEGEERSMARLVVELDSRKCEPAPRVDSLSPPEDARRKRLGPVKECITVKGESDSEASTPRRSPRRAPASTPVIPSTPVEAESSQSSVRRSKRKRKRTAEVADSTQKKRKHQKPGQNVDADAVPESQIGNQRDDLSAHDTSSSAALSDDSMGREGSQELGMPASSSPVPFREDHFTDAESPTADSSDISETEAINSQLLAEASQDSFSSHAEQQHVDDEPTAYGEVAPADRLLVAVKDEHGAAEMADVETEDADMMDIAETGLGEAEGAKSPASTIMESLRAGLEALRTAQLRRREVYEIEDMFMDIKKELYAAEERSRGSRH